MEVTDGATSGRGPGPPPGSAAEPPGEPPNAAFLLIALGRAMRAQAEVGLRELGLSMRHFSALGHLGRQPGLSYSELARRARITVQSKQATLDQLEALHAIERRTAPGRGRAAQLHLTPTGRMLLSSAQDLLRDVDQGLAAGLGPEDHDVLSGLLFRAFLATSPRDGAVDNG
jgi:DNA-binding MarR family transcriptional regulator